MNGKIIYVGKDYSYAILDKDIYILYNDGYTETYKIGQEVELNTHTVVIPIKELKEIILNKI